MKSGFVFGMISAAAMLLVSAPAFAQGVGFSCPKPGTVEMRGGHTYSYAGVSTRDPYFCTGTYDGKPMGKLFNFYPPGFLKTPNVRDGMVALMTGKQTSVTLTLESGSTETWTLLRREPLTIGGKTYNTVVFSFDRHRYSNSRNPFHGKFTRWLDPANGLWLKATLDTMEGETQLEYQPYVDSAVIIP